MYLRAKNVEIWPKKYCFVTNTFDYSINFFITQLKKRKKVSVQFHLKTYKYILFEHFFFVYYVEKYFQKCVAMTIITRI